MKSLKGDLLKILCEPDDEPQRQTKPKTPNINRLSYKSVATQQVAKPPENFKKSKVNPSVALKPIENNRRSRVEEDSDIHKNCVDASDFIEFTDKYKRCLDEYRKEVNKHKALVSEVT